jgi:plastocyanin
MRTIGRIGALVAGVALVGMFATSLVVAANGSVSIAGLAYHPATVTVNVGEHVTWTNADGTDHTATANDGSFDTGIIGDGASAAVTFASAGTFPYHCAIHRSMTGAVVVVAAAAPSPTPKKTPVASAPTGGVTTTPRPTGGAPIPAPATDTLPNMAGAVAADPGAWLLGTLGVCMLIGTLLADRRLGRRDD